MAMVRWLFLGVLLELLTLFSSPGDLSRISIYNMKFINEILDTHNRYRSDVQPRASDMLFLSWDDGLAKTARAWSRICKFSHNPDMSKFGKGHPEFDFIGENMYVSPVDAFTVRNSLNVWHQEMNNFNYHTNKCDGSCDNYTQMIWASSYKIGCALHFCGRGIQDFNRNPGTIFICNYGPPGNDRISKPYNIGVPCFGCPEETCTNRLCSKAKRYHKWSPKYSLASIFFCNQPLLLTSIIAAYILQ
ncbi:GLIPR1-like protein 1 isoform X2 [Callorhinchus milii]|uniref:GLIPR1-like protein 1 isoform X2 n=1 Tax=Callorhinchus milii TaxID=7868 RepID=UPI001C3FE2B6|nr:GLIPR1-like protein 1 isoform X2 [Callorhinchus milii]